MSLLVAPAAASYQPTSLLAVLAVSLLVPMALALLQKQNGTGHRRVVYLSYIVTS
ncbi:hypothetical protein CONLIGDRAFT_627331 [Coniochaeta ligniaria NRRL 30616]|uniref:Uncharacterized protein n=1 Tax=Coniochaeta ligniaria NRRL 30616 TaxID=1408157 RepID=A0A1J7J553_9PEZI|nr:hypothetical protein CONLIGDRAFT_627331 [Coniochaeta ligniaria NRRL 30616]